MRARYVLLAARDDMLWGEGYMALEGADKKFKCVARMSPSLV